MSQPRKPTAAQVRKVLQAYEREVLNPVLAWRRLLAGGDPLDDWLEQDLHAVHRGLRVLHDDVAQGLVMRDPEGSVVGGADREERQTPSWNAKYGIVETRTGREWCLPACDDGWGGLYRINGSGGSWVSDRE